VACGVSSVADINQLVIGRLNTSGDKLCMARLYAVNEAAASYHITPYPLIPAPLAARIQATIRYSKVVLILEQVAATAQQAERRR